MYTCEYFVPREGSMPVMLPWSWITPWIGCSTKWRCSPCPRRNDLIVRMMNAASGRRVSITVVEMSSESSVVSGSRIATLTVRSKSSSRNANRSMMNVSSRCASMSSKSSGGIARQYERMYDSSRSRCVSLTA